MNSLGRDLIISDKIIMTGDGSKEDRTVVIIGGCGRMSKTPGTCLFIQLPDKTYEFKDSMDIFTVVEENVFEDR